jgi:PAS domain S-box-containing protein
MADLEMTASRDDALAKIRSLEEELENARELLAAAATQEADKARYFEAELRRRSHVLDVVLSNIPDLICTFDLDGNFTYANPALLGVWRRSLEEIVGKNTFDLGYPPDLAARIQAEVRPSSHRSSQWSTTRRLPARTGKPGCTNISFLRYWPGIVL